MAEGEKGNFWEIVTSQSRLYRLRETDISEQTEFDKIMAKARQIANTRQREVHIDVYFEGEWHPFDVAYPASYSAPFHFTDVQQNTPKSSTKEFSKKYPSSRNSIRCPKCNSLNSSKNDLGTCHCWQCHHSWSS